LWIPLTFLSLACLADGKQWRVGLAWTPVVSAAGLALSVAVEFLQVFLPARSPSVVDVASQTAGGLAGAALWLSVGPMLVGWSRRLGGALPLYVVLLLFLHLLPCDLSLSPAELVRKARRGLIVVWPLWTNDVEIVRLVEKALQQVVLFAPLGWLLARGELGRAHGRRAFVLGLVAVAGLEALHLIVVGRYFDTRDILAGWAGLTLGWQLANLERRWLASHCVFAAWIALVVVLGWLPFDFQSRPDAPFRLPFADYQEGDYLHVLDQAVGKFLTFVPGGAWMAWRWRRGWTAVGTAAGLAALVEIGQIFLPGRFFSVSDVIVEVLGAAAGARWAVAERHQLTVGPAVSS
jgi:VanZ family protein